MLSGAALMLSQGCAQWSTRGEHGSDEAALGKVLGDLPAMQIPRDATVLEIGFLSFPHGSPSTPELGSASSGDLPKELASIDESIVPPEVRNCFRVNGLRIGRIAQADDLLSLPQPTADPNERLLREASVLSDFSTHQRHLTCREGQTYPLAVRRMINGSQVVLMRDRRGSVVGRSVDSPQFMVNLQAFRSTTDGALVTLVPEIQHGQVRQNYVANETLAIRFDYSRQRWELEDLAVEVPLSPGQAIVLLPSLPPFGLGEQMLVGRRADQFKEMVGMVIRLKRRPTTPLEESSIQ